VTPCIEQGSETGQVAGNAHVDRWISKVDMMVLAPSNVGRRGQKPALDFSLRLIREAVGTKIARNFAFDLTLSRDHHGVEESAKETRTSSRWRPGGESAFGNCDWSISNGSSPSIGFDDSKAFPVFCALTGR
jgi:hypothetical protein